MKYFNALRILCIFVLQQIVFGAYSIGYQPHDRHEAEIKMMNFGASFKESPTAEQVADIVSRLSAKAPLLWEDNVNLPTVHAFENSDVVSSPMVVEVYGGVLPITVISAVKVPLADNEAPEFSDVISALRRNGVHPETKSIKIGQDNAADIQSVLQNRARPIIVLYNDGMSSPMTSRRFLATTNSTNTTVPISEFQISQYQICLWTAVMMVLLVAFAVCSIVNMDVVPDNILYAKFQSGRIENKRD